MKTPSIAILVLFWKAQFSIEKFIKCLISYWIEYNSSDLEIWEIPCVFFEFIIYNESDFELKSFQYVSFHTNFQPRFRFWFEHFTTCQISNQLSKHASYFESNVLKRIRFWIEKNFKPLCFELKIFRHVRFQRIVCIPNLTLWFILIPENAMYCFCAVFKSTSLNWKKCYVSYVEWKNTTGQTSKYENNIASFFWV